MKGAGGLSLQAFNGLLIVKIVKRRGGTTSLVLVTQPLRRLWKAAAPIQERATSNRLRLGFQL